VSVCLSASISPELHVDVQSSGGVSIHYFIYLCIYLLRPKAAQHDITITKTEETHKKVKTEIRKN